MNTKIHILFTIPNFDTAGSGKVVYDLVNQLDTSRFKVSIACNHDSGAFFKTVAALGVPIHLINTTVPLRPYHTLLKRIKPYRDLLKNEKVDIVHSWNWSSDWSEALACKLVGIPFVYTKKSMGWGNKHWHIRSYLSAFIITVNSDMKSFFSRKRQQKLIPFGLDLEQYNPIRCDQTKKTNVFKIITVANLVRVKNIEFLITAINALRHLHITLEIVGDTRGDYARELQRFVADLKLESQVQFLGRHADVRPLLASSDLYVIPSKQEGMPMALVEAMAMAVPVLGANVAGVRYVLQDFNDLQFDLDDLQSLVLQIEKQFYLSVEARLTLGAQLRDYCKQHFSMKTFINAHENLYLKLVRNK
tara:strand:+ start:19101 stop:20183 length:1083 start_codon:yes stop_codon:yes gene_type:complete